MNDANRDELDRLFLRLVRAVRDARPEYLSRGFEVGELLDFVPYRAVRADLGVDTNDDYAHAVTRLLAGERGYLFADDLMQDDLASELASPNPDLAAYRAYLNARVTLSQEHARRVLEAMGPPGDAVVPAEAVNTEAINTEAVNTEAVNTEAVPAAEPPAARATATDTVSPAPAEPTATAAASAKSRVRPATSTPKNASAKAIPRPFVPPRPSSSPRPLDPDADLSHRASRPGCRYCGQPLPEGRDVQFCPQCGQNLRVRRCAACSAELEPAWKFCVACGRAATP